MSGVEVTDSTARVPDVCQPQGIYEGRRVGSCVRTQTITSDVVTRSPTQRNLRRSGSGCYFPGVGQKTEGVRRAPGLESVTRDTHGTPVDAGAVVPLPPGP